jgi:hypothetical protein
MKHVEAVIRMFDPDTMPGRSRFGAATPPTGGSKRGAMFPAVLDVLKAAEGPLTVRELGRARPTPISRPSETLKAACGPPWARKKGKTNVGQDTPARWAISDLDVS